MVDPIPAEAAEQAGFVLELCAIGVLNVAAALAVMLLRWPVTWWSVVGLQLAVFLLALVEAVRTDPVGWIAFSGLPLTTALLLVGLRFVKARLKPPVRQIAG